MGINKLLLWLRKKISITSLKSFLNKFDNYLKDKKLPPFLKNAKLIIGSAGVFLIIIIVLIAGSFSGGKTNVPVYKVVKGNFQVSITESGEIRAKNATSIVTPRVKGSLKITYIVPEGKYVQAGDTVVKFDPTEALTNLKDAESKLEITISDKAKLLADQKSQLTNLESALKSAQLSFELSKLNLEQMKFEAEIKQQQAKLEHEKNKLSLLKAKQDLESQKIIQKSELSKIDLQVEQDRANLEKAKRDLAALTLTAPKEGLVVYEINWSTGRKVMIGDTPWSGMPIVSLPDLSAMQSLTYVNEVDVSRVKKGQKVIVKLDAFQDSTFTGFISAVAPLGKNKDKNSNIKVFEVEVDIQSQSTILKPGMTTSNKIVIDQIPNVIYIPQESVFEKEGKKIVYIKNGSGFDDQQVETGEKSEDYIVVKKGLKPGDEVALLDPNLKPGELEINSEKSSSGNSPAMVK